MPGLVRLTPADARLVPWRNGRGVTEEIAIGPPGSSFEAGDFAWRVSRARVLEDGPFSAFPGLDRVIVVLEGAGLVLSHGPGRPPRRVGLLEPYAFSGDLPTSAALVAGPVRDFNVIVRRGLCRVGVEVLRLEAEPRAITLPAGHVLVHVVAAAARAGAADPDGARAGSWSLEPGDSLLGTGLPAGWGLEMSGIPGAAAIVAGIEPSAA